MGHKVPPSTYKKIRKPVHSIWCFHWPSAQMADGTRLKVLDEVVKSVQESQSTIHKELDFLTSSFASHQQMLQEILNRLPTSPPTSTSKSISGLSSTQSSTPLGTHKPAPIQFARFSGENLDRWVL
ncbi:hypothetical protein J1N35_018174 [Gossypium stocksii]|uniref:Uncharacterized protein n=1 Tax=Gossypium stocksii TaxID=47602 RepID=A0A9D3VPI5_9ROSI|nr:hypothetical protein J1N35_018174 [Gossypium stocksii]